MAQPSCKTCASSARHACVAEEVSDATLAEKLESAARRVQDGERARAERARLIGEASRRGWKLEKIAQYAGITHQAVSKQLNKKRRSRPDITE